MIEDIFKKIKEDYSEERVAMLFDEKVPEWLDGGWEEDFDDAYEAYQEQGRGEAEDEVIGDIIRGSLNRYYPNQKLKSDEFSQLREKIVREYDILNFVG